MAERFAHPWVDSTRAPLLQCRFPDNPSVADVSEFCAVTERFFAQSNDPVGWVTDLSRVHSVGAMQRKLFMEANRRIEARLRERLVAMAVYAPGSFQRGLVTLFSWFMPVAFPFKVFAQRGEAITWVLERLPPAVPEQP